MLDIPVPLWWVKCMPCGICELVANRVALLKGCPKSCVNIYYVGIRKKNVFFYVFSNKNWKDTSGIFLFFTAHYSKQNTFFNLFLFFTFAWRDGEEEMHDKMNIFVFILSLSTHFKNHCPQKTTNTFTPPQKRPFLGGVNFFSERGLILS